VNVTVEETVTISKPREKVFEFTQDWSRRQEWDESVVAAVPLPGEERAYRVRGAAGVSFEARYKLFRAPERTSLAMEKVVPEIFTGGGGSWDYAAEGRDTRWTQTNTLTLSDGLVSRIIAPIMRWQLRAATRKAMLRAKKLLETSDG
jgi:hypothetical protein